MVRASDRHRGERLRGHADGRLGLSGGGAIDETRVLETHISWIFLVGDRAYKLKKPLKLPFVDQSTPQAREELCHRECELNRRLAPDVYLGVLDVTREGGQIVDHLVEMRRMPDDRRLSTLVASGAGVDGCLRQLARDVAAFHASAMRSDEISAYASQDAVRRMWSENLGQTERFVGPIIDRDVFDRVVSLADRYLDGRGRLFVTRAVARHTCDGHGDLLVDDVFCLDDGPRALDCIEFDDRLRWGDVVNDVAFLAMDLERVGAPALAERFLDWYREFSAESYPKSLANHYVAYRASIRAKVACLKHEQGDAPSRDRARHLMDMCESHLDQARIRLVLVGGLPGTGKSTLADGLSNLTGWTVLRSDEIRKDLGGIPHAEHRADAFGEGLYTQQMTERTYATLLERAEALLGLGASVILDASWAKGAYRARAELVAQRTSTDLVSIRCVLAPEVAARRMRARSRAGTDISDADATVARAMAAVIDPWPEAAEIETATAPGEVSDAALRVAAPPHGRPS